MANQFANFPGISGNVLGGYINVEFPYYFDVTYTTSQTSSASALSNSDFSYLGYPLVVRDMITRFDAEENIYYTTTKIGIKEYDLSVDGNIEKQEALDKKLKDILIKVSNNYSSVESSQIIYQDIVYRQPAESYTYTPKILKYDYSDEDKNTSNNQQDTIIIDNDPERASECPLTDTLVYDFLMNYDVSGPTKTKEINTYTNGILTEQEVIVYGFAYSTVDDNLIEEIGGRYSFADNDLSNYWRVVESYKTVFNYSNNVYNGYTKTGNKLVRFFQEIDLSVYELRDDNQYPEIASLYSFKNIPFMESEAFIFGDLNKDYDEEYKSEKFILKDVYDPLTGKMRRLSIPNPDYKPSLYVKERQVYSRCFDKKIVPENAPFWNGSDNHMVTTGHENKIIEQVNIVRKDENHQNCIYSVYRLQESAQDADFKNNLRISNTETFIGRPPQVPYLDFDFEETNQPPINEIVYAGLRSPIDKVIDSVYYPEPTIDDAFQALKKDEDFKFLTNMDGDQINIIVIGQFLALPGSTAYVKDVGSGVVKSVTVSFEKVSLNTYNYHTKLTLIKKNGALAKPSTLLKKIKEELLVYDSSDDINVNSFIPESIIQAEGRNKPISKNRANN